LHRKNIDLLGYNDTIYFLYSYTRYASEGADGRPERMVTRNQHSNASYARANVTMDKISHIFLHA
jgi:hypothetical protein